MSLKKRIQILLAFLVGVPLVLLLYESYRAGAQTLVEQMKEGALQIARLEASQIDMVFSPPRLVSEAVGRALETDPELSPERIRALLAGTLKETPSIHGATVALDPEVTSQGHFSSHFYRKEGVELEHPKVGPTHDYTHTEWYRLPLKSGHGVWTKPYFSEYGDEKVLMITFSAPIHHKGHVAGVASVDLDLEGLVGRLQQIKPGGKGTAYLVNKEGRIIAHPQLGAIGHLTDGPDLGGLAELMQRKGVDMLEMADPISKQKSWIVETPVSSLSAAQGGQDWSLIVSWPIGTRLAYLTGLGRQMVVLYLFLGGASLLILNRSFDHLVTRPVKKLAEQARQYAEGNFSQPPRRVEEALEMRELGQALDSLGEALAKKSEIVVVGNREERE